MICGRFFTRAISFKLETCEAVKAALDAELDIRNKLYTHDSYMFICVVVIVIFRMLIHLTAVKMNMEYTFTVAHVDAEDHVGNSWLQIWELMFGPKAQLFSG